jgi:hypothetical protein
LIQLRAQGICDAPIDHRHRQYQLAGFAQAQRLQRGPHREACGHAVVDHQQRPIG